MKNLIFLVLLISLLSACQNTMVNSESDGEEDLSNQYSKAYDSENKIADVNTKLGAGYIANGRYDRALVKLKKALRHDPDYALAHNYLGVLYGRLERPELAYKEFNKSMSLSNNDSAMVNNYALFLCEQKEFDKAREKFKQVINNPLYINRAGAYQSSAWCAYQNNNYPLSEELYRTALEMNPYLSRSLLGLAKIYYKQQSYEQAWNYFTRFDDASTLDADSLWLGINILNKLEYPDKNLLSSYILQLKSKFPDTDEARWFYQGKQEY